MLSPQCLNWDHTWGGAPTGLHTCSFSEYKESGGRLRIPVGPTAPSSAEIPTTPHWPKFLLFLLVQILSEPNSNLRPACLGLLGKARSCCLQAALRRESGGPGLFKLGGQNGSPARAAPQEFTDTEMHNCPTGTGPEPQMDSTYKLLTQGAHYLPYKVQSMRPGLASLTVSVVLNVYTGYWSCATTGVQLHSSELSQGRQAVCVPLEKGNAGVLSTRRKLK